MKRSSYTIDWKLWMKVYCFVLSIFVGIIATILAQIKCPFDPAYMILPTAPMYSGPLTINSELTNAELLFEGNIFGPESFVVSHNMLYAGLADGSVIKGDLTKRNFVRIKEKTCKNTNLLTCSRPSGMRMDSWAHLNFMNSKDGFIVYDPAIREEYDMYQPKSGEKHHFNDLSFLKNGKTVFSDSSTRFVGTEIFYDFLESRHNGRLMQYDPVSKTVSVFVKDLNFPDGVQEHDDKDSILIVESSMYRILRYYYTGIHAGTTELFIHNLPGVGHKIRPSSDKGYWLALSPNRSRGSFSFVDFVSTRPWIRSLLGKLYSAETLSYFFGPRGCLIIKLDRDGRIIRSLHDPTLLQVPSCTQAVESSDGYLYIGSSTGDNIARVKL